MPPKETCKVVKRANERGARIHPRGCKVRTTVSATGAKTKVNKEGQIKRTAKTQNRAFKVIVRRTENANMRARLVWDTGAMLDTMSYEDADRLNLLEGRVRHPSSIQGAVGGGQSFEIRNVPLWVTLIPNTPATRIVSEEIYIHPPRLPGAPVSGTKNLLGTASIKKLSKVYKVKFKDINN